MNVTNSFPPVRGRIRRGVPLSGMSWFRVGGPAEAMFTPADKDDLRSFLAELDPKISVRVVGRMSNLLVRDGGVEGVVIRLGRAFLDIRISGATLEAGAAAFDADVAHAARDAGLGGFGFFAGIPGSVGGAIRMNAGCHGSETAQVLSSVRAIDRQGNIHDVDASSLHMRYRETGAPEDWIFISARFRGSSHSSVKTITECMERFRKEREESQPLKAATGGSTFRNPDGEHAWRLIERAGCRGLRRGGAKVSEKHANFLVNEGNATAADLEGLAEEVRTRVLECSGVCLKWEIHRMGRPVCERDS